jgi:hypothetical protein
MNCKPGDLAVIKNHIEGIGYNGRIVEVVGYCGTVAAWRDCWWVKPLGWAPPLSSCELSVAGDFLFPDSLLRPIRDNPGADETLTWAGKPATINQPKETA